MIILRSTVKVGTSKNIVHKILKKTGKKFSLSYCPERTQEGKALEEIIKLPQIIGGFDNISTLRSKNLFKRITK